MNIDVTKRIVILGAAGFIGYHLSNAISKIANVNLVLVDNFVRGKNDDYYNDFAKSNKIKVLELDLSLENSYHGLFQNNDIVINCAALNGTQNFYNFPVEVIRHSAMTSILAAEYSSLNKVSKYIYLGTPESYAGGINLGIVNIPTNESVPLIIEDPLNSRWSYAASKSMGEIAALANREQYGLNISILRVHNIYGPRMGDNHVVPDLVEKFLNNNFDVVGINESRSFMYIDDLVTILNKLIFGEIALTDCILHVGSTREILIGDLAYLILDILNLKSQINPIANFRGSVLRRVPDTTLLKSICKFEETDLRTGILKYIDWYKNNNQNF